ncbi:oxidoreductase, short chain dehydrogenase/reductase family protein [Trichomonas vaginalis G3]|uniref:Oxidoreductase, short chain dehydrogenase/reductase family protein n=2 Tax=Trichomonas vaginalis (strain ATCC PRA-98 / G3) TaxID=412133 RepID=A2DRM9_TRIV3|nr:oxidation-reduction process [Trichomonas vaginalis G3]EAY16992.1 oxidoreductase, short chain dehydrogenase/reductase family protein [Trichomonas vaginalis G3]KAI5508955.1 oxidation-reduction process [Trichomonas vaginalis G3]|eukprot:XP_001329215.1 oxidoreductase, short chain dehydrogenase/reductase family protein [Trichomonas vaginalis G3]
MESKIIVITGASDGIGKYTALQLAKQGHTIIIHGRSPEKTKAASEEIINETGNKNVKYYLADFLDFTSIKEFAETLKREYDHIDVLINNAGAQFGSNRETTRDGHEKTMMVNVFAPFLLTNLLLPSLKKSKSARVVTVSSASHNMGGEPPLDDIELEKSYSMPRSYGFSKLYVIWVMRHFIKYANENGINNITFNCVHPGSTNTSLGRESTKSWLWWIIYMLWKPMMNSMEDAARPSITCATSGDLEGVTGKYYGPKGEDTVYEKYYTVENEQKVWDYCMNITKQYL